MSAAPMRELDFELVDAAEMRRRAQEFRAAMSRRRTVRDFSARPVAREIIEQAVMTAAGAPSGANQQPWSFVCIADPAVKRDIRLAAEAEEKAFYDGRAGEEWLQALVPFGTDWRKPFLETAPWLIAIFAQRHGVGADGAKIKHYYANESVGIACGFLLAALHHAGLATLTHTPSPMNFLARICGRPAREKPFVLVVAGYPQEHCQVPAIAKKPFAEVAHFIEA